MMIFLKQKSCIFLAVFIFCLLFFAGAVSAATVNVNPGTGTIQAAVTSANAGDTLNLSAGNYNDHEVTINKNLTIQGPTVANGNPPTAVVDGQTSGRIFFINGDVTVTMQYLLFKNGYTDESGGAVCNQGNLTVKSCRFTNNNADSGGGAISNEITGTCTISNSTFISNNAPSSDGGAIYNYLGSASISIAYCNFTNNTATDNGGAIYNYKGTVYLTNSKVYNSTANAGGGIYNYLGNVTLTSSQVYNNNATLYNGGGIYNYVGNVTLYNSYICQNTASVNRGGGIFNTGNVTLTYSNMYQNTAANGGGIFNTGNVTLTFSNIYQNTASNGGGIYNDGITILTGSYVYNNTAWTEGGGIYNYSSGTLNLTNYSQVFNNTAWTDSGGGIFNYVGTVTLINFSVIYHNTATYGGGFYNFCGTLTSTNSSIYRNNATFGGGIFNEGITTLNGINLSYNTATNYGGAIYNQGTMTLRFCILIENSPPSVTDIYSDYGSVDAELNWWGSNTDPSSRVSSGVDVSPWLVLNVTANPTFIKNGGTSIITADLLHDSDNIYHNPASGHVLDGTGVSFATTLGTINSPSFTVNGVANTTLNGGAVTGVANVTATFHSQTVHTPVIIDASTPSVTSTNPAQYAVNLPSNQVFTVTYNEAIKAGNLNLVVLKTSTGTIIATTKTIASNVLTITPNSPLSEAKYLLLVYAGSVTDIAGNPAAALSRTYGVGAQPYVTSTDPTNYATNVPRNKVITVTFNEPIVAKYLTLIYLKTATGGIQVATIKNVSGNTLTITPTTPLAANTRYMVLIYTFAVTDLAGNSNVNKAITFTTGAT